MPYCPYCGKEVSSDMSFCPSCGASLNTNELLSYTLTDEELESSGNYRIYITSLGTSKESVLIDLLEDVLGYTTNVATNFVNNIPVQIAGNLSLKQAAVIAQAFEEYGAEIAVTNGDDYEDISSQTSSSSLFNSDGSILASAAIILASIGAVNRLRSVNKPKKPSILEKLFHSLFKTRKNPPVHVRRHISLRGTTLRSNEQHHYKPVIKQQIKPAGKAHNKRPNDHTHGGSSGSHQNNHSHGKGIHR